MGNLNYIRQITPINNSEHEILDSRHCLINGEKMRVYPATGQQVELDQLDGVLYYAGDALNGESSLVHDKHGNWRELTKAEFKAVYHRCVDQVRKELHHLVDMLYLPIEDDKMIECGSRTGTWYINTFATRIYTDGIKFAFRYDGKIDVAAIAFGTDCHYAVYNNADNKKLEKDKLEIIGEVEQYSIAIG